MTAAVRAIAVEGWDPSMGSALSPLDRMAASPGPVDVDVEVAGADWGPVSPAPDAAARGPVRFVDGVRRIEGTLWLSTPGERTRQALAASIAAGTVCCDGPKATVEACEVQRLLLGPAGTVPTLPTSAGAFEARGVADDDADTLRAGVQERLRKLERRLLAAAADADLLLVDGPLDAGVAVDHAVGYVKTHHVAYLDDEVATTVAALAPGQRTPVFLATSSWTRFSWYLRLPYGSGHEWAGIVRCEASGDLSVAEVVALADRTAATLPRFASQPHKDRRAPQNLYPIGGLEQQLTHRLGDAAHVLRALRAAAAGH
ncbi:hypothetical protein FTX61_02570 [Nitriliruptoraceae bacterium ZYF776]|nr:hypothetical protein [Profundirhabdus halotolerans]